MLPADHIHNNDVFRSVRKKWETDLQYRFSGALETCWIGRRSDGFSFCCWNLCPPSYLFFELIWLYGNFLIKIYSFLQIWCIAGLLLLLPIDLLPAQVGTNNWCGRLKTLRPEQRECMDTWEYIKYNKMLWTRVWLWRKKGFVEDSGKQMSYQK